MVLLQDADRQEISGEFQNSELGTFGAILKAELKAAVDATDAWLEANKLSYNSALPLPARTALTADQKARLLVWVIKKRYKLGA